MILLSLAFGYLLVLGLIVYASYELVGLMRLWANKGYSRTRQRTYFYSSCGFLALMLLVYTWFFFYLAVPVIFAPINLLLEG